MTIDTNQEKIDSLLERGVFEVIDKEHLRKKLLSGEKLRVKLGIDPTSPNLHIGRSIPILKLKDFQELGHQVVFIVGDFTGTIGDTSDKESERPALSDEQVKKNMETYIEQVSKIIDIDKTEIKYNSEWLKELDYKEICRQADLFSLSEFIARKNIKTRLEKENRISLRELMYPLMQGYDSVAVKADVELGGTDQRFNLLAGREIQSFYDQEPQDIMTNVLIEGPDGRKMSSSWGNVINFLDSSEDMFGKLMSMTDEMIIPYFENCTRVPMNKVGEYEKQLKNNEINPRDIKLDLAFEITKIYWGEEKAEQAKDHFVSVIQNKDIPEDVPEKQIAGMNVVEALVESGLSKSKSDARRLIEQGGVTVNGEKVTSIEETISKGDIIKKGKRFFVEAK
jgi:tyrosyl-tRNA synthetase